MSSRRGIDHLVLAVEDLSAARDQFAAFGFLTTPLGRHPWGTGNHLVQFPRNFIEILGVVDASKLVPMRDDHFSFAPVDGWALGEPRPGFDQQPVEAAAMADACIRAWSMTGDKRWKDRVGLAAGWFLGANDTGATLYDPQSGGCGDGLEHDRVNQNRGAESTLAALAAMQQADMISRAEARRASSSAACGLRSPTL